MESLLKKNIDKYMKISNETLNFLTEKAVYIKLKPRDSFLQAGKVAKRVGFLKRGILRAYFIDKQANNVTSYFYYLPKNDIVTLHTSFAEETPAQHTIEAVTESEVFFFWKNDLIKAEEKFQEISQLRRIIAEQQYMKSSKRINDLQTKSARDLYNDFVNEADELILNVPQHMIASYLGMSQFTLSRIKQK